MSHSKSIIRSKIRAIPDFPKKGIIFRDVSTLFLDPEGWRVCIDELTNLANHFEFNKFIGIEARGFGLAGTLAYRLNKGFVMARKAGKLPHDVIQTNYNLEYGSQTLEIHKDALNNKDRVVIIDDLLATGGTVLATANLCQKLGAQVVACLFIVNLPELKGDQNIQKYNPEWLVEFEGH